MRPPCFFSWYFHLHIPHAFAFTAHPVSLTVCISHCCKCSLQVPYLCVESALFEHTAKNQWIYAQVFNSGLAGRPFAGTLKHRASLVTRAKCSHIWRPPHANCIFVTAWLPISEHPCPHFPGASQDDASTDSRPFGNRNNHDHIYTHALHFRVPRNPHVE